MWICFSKRMPGLTPLFSSIGSTEPSSEPLRIQTDLFCSATTSLRRCQTSLKKRYPQSDALSGLAFPTLQTCGSPSMQVLQSWLRSWLFKNIINGWIRRRTWIDGMGTLSHFQRKKGEYSSHWTGNAYNRIVSEHYKSFVWRVWEKTGCLITADGSDDAKIYIYSPRDSQRTRCSRHC